MGKISHEGETSLVSIYMLLMVDISGLDYHQCNVNAGDIGSNQLLNLIASGISVALRITVWKNRKSDAKITARATSTFFMIFFF